MKSIRRRNKWDLGGDRELFFSPRHIRLASHYNGDSSNKRWKRQVDEEDNNEQENDGYELSEREKVWKEQMERMRKRIEIDPYEAIFGRRIQPFWAHLMPQWGPEEHRDVKDKPKTDNSTPEKPQTTSYAYSSSTSWDSWTNKVKKSEWDSISGEKKDTEYDPISNRMVAVVKKESVAQPEVPTAASAVSNQAGGSSNASEVKAVDTTPQELRKAIPIPQFADPAQITIDDLTASSIRASMGKPKSSDHHQIAALLNEGKTKKTASSNWDHAEQYYMLEQELQRLQAKKDNLVNEERRSFHFGDLARRYEQIETKIKDTMDKLEAINNEQIQAAVQEQPSSKSTLTTALQRGATAPKKVVDAPLRSAVDRMQSKTVLEIDDSAAHESTEATSAVPKAWADQANLLQSDRVKRTTSKTPFPDPVPEWVHKMADRQEAAAKDTAAHERAAKLSKADAVLQSEVNRQKSLMHSREERHPDESRRVQKDAITNTEADKLRAELRTEYDAKISDIQTKAKAKVAALKQELDLAYQQSSRHADEFRNQIQKASQRGEDAKALEAKYKGKLAAMKENLDLAYKQSSKHADEFRRQLQQLTDQLKRVNAAGGSLSTMSSIDQVPAPQSKDEEKQREHALLKEIRGIYEQAYSAIGKEIKTQPTMKDALAGFDKMTGYEIKNDNIIEDPDHATFQAQENDNAYAFKADNLETELKEKDPRVVDEETGVYQFRNDNLETELKGKAPQVVDKDIIDYTFHKDNLETELKGKNLPVIDEETGAYEFRKDNLEAELAAKTQTGSETAFHRESKSYAFEDDGLEAELKRKSSSSVAKLSQRLAAELSDVSKLVNEVKHGRPISSKVDEGQAAPATGNYASPTGFVNFDPLFPKENAKPETANEPIDYDEIDIRHYPRVKREESVFTGTRRVRPSRRDARKEHRHERRFRARRVTRYLLVGGALVLSGAYIQGMQMEKTEMKRIGHREAWEKMAQEYSRSGERGIVEAIKEIKDVDSKWSSGLFWK